MGGVHKGQRERGRKQVSHKKSRIKMTVSQLATPGGKIEWKNGLKIIRETTYNL